MAEISSSERESNTGIWFALVDLRAGSAFSGPRSRTLITVAGGPATTLLPMSAGWRPGTPLPSGMWHGRRRPARRASRRGCPRRASSAPPQREQRPRTRRGGGLGGALAAVAARFSPV
jgi:hypothetical protein